MNKTITMALALGLACTTAVANDATPANLEAAQEDAASQEARQTRATGFKTERLERIMVIGAVAGDSEHRQARQDVRPIARRAEDDFLAGAD